MSERYDPFNHNSSPNKNQRAAEKNSRIKDVIYAGSLVLAATVFPAYGALEGHTHAERAHSAEFLEAEGLAALAGLEVAAGRKMIAESRKPEQS